MITVDVLTHQVSSWTPDGIVTTTLVPGLWVRMDRPYSYARGAGFVPVGTIGQVRRIATRLGRGWPRRTRIVVQVTWPDCPDAGRRTWYRIACLGLVGPDQRFGFCDEAF